MTPSSAFSAEHETSLPIRAEAGLWTSSAGRNEPLRTSLMIPLRLSWQRAQVDGMFSWNNHQSLCEASCSMEIKTARKSYFQSRGKDFSCDIHYGSKTWDALKQILSWENKLTPTNRPEPLWNLLNECRVFTKSTRVHLNQQGNWPYECWLCCHDTHLQKMYHFISNEKGKFKADSIYGKNT